MAPATPSFEPISTDFPRSYAITRRYTLGEPKSITPTEDGRYAFFLRSPAREPRNSLWEVEIATGAIRELLRPESLAPGEEKISAEEKARRERQRIRVGGFTSFQATSDGSVIVVGLSGRLYAWTRATGKAHELPTGPGSLIDPQLSPDGTKVAYARSNDVYVVPLKGGKETAITRGGTETNPHGVAEFMAQEEFARLRGFWWSPDSSEILYEDADLSAVPKWALADPGRPDAPAQVIAYPKTGKPQAIVRLAIASVRNPGRPVRKVTWDSERYPYLFSVTWTKNAPPTLNVIDRPFRHSALLAVETAAGAGTLGTKPLLTETDAAWLGEEVSVPRWLPDGSAFLWSTERNGSWELELHDRQGAKLSTVAAPSVGYRALVGVDAEKKVAYITASSEPIRDELWAVPFDGGAPQSISKNTDGRFLASFGDHPRIYGFGEATQGAERRFGVRSVDGSVNIPIPSVAEAPPFKANIEFTTIGKDSFRVALVRPRSFDPQRRYPLLDHIYGGSWSNQVYADAHRYLAEQWLADTTQSIVAIIDGYGTPRRGRNWERAFLHRYDTLSIEGHAEAIAELAKKYPAIDASRVGIYGWSHGGYSSAMAILRRPDVFKVGVAGAPVADPADYDAFAERFLGVPPNPDYTPASLLTWAARPPSPTAPIRPLLLIHGTADDNVYILHSLKFAEAMARAGRPVEFMPLIGQTHMVTDPDSHAAVEKRTAEYFREHLHGPRSSVP
ncbi:DPP IV N-terminal domain-containing protein [Pendulispora albinea]|uniref:S9 family peptidase n=1 Tax=Pendulispora albinea TaxID=2741071 RepID=A0ABZ2LUV0_9BACT